MRQHPLAWIVWGAGGALNTTPLPVQRVCDDDGAPVRILGHFARRNAHLGALASERPRRRRSREMGERQDRLAANVVGFETKGVDVRRCATVRPAAALPAGLPPATPIDPEIKRFIAAGAIARWVGAVQAEDITCASARSGPSPAPRPTIRWCMQCFAALARTRDSLAPHERTAAATRHLLAPVERSLFLMRAASRSLLKSNPGTDQLPSPRRLI